MTFRFQMNGAVCDPSEDDSEEDTDGDENRYDADGGRD
jgi:hypothetical protein